MYALAKWLKSFGLALAVFVCASLISASIVAIGSGVAAQFSSKTLDPNSEGSFECYTIFFANYPLARCDAAQLGVTMLMFGGLPWAVLATPVTAPFTGGEAWEDINLGSQGLEVSLSLLVYVYIFGLAIYLSQVFDKDRVSTKDLVGRPARRALLVTVCVLLSAFAMMVLFS